MIRRWRKIEEEIAKTDQIPKRMRTISSPLGGHFGNRSRCVGAGRKPQFDEVDFTKITSVNYEMLKFTFYQYKI